MRVFVNLKGEEYNSLITEYEFYLPEYFGKLDQAYNDYPFAKDNEEYMLYVHYNKWPIRKLEYSFVITEMKEAIFDGAKVLDAGCGVSSMPFLWAKLGGNVTAVDFDEKNINLMNQFNNDDYFQINKKIKMELCDIMKLPYADNTFDIVTTTSVIEHLPYPNYLLAINELYRVLKPEGTLICTCDIKAESESKRNAVGGFSTEDMKDILSHFKEELLGELQDLDCLKITENEIGEFWNSHYYDGIGYVGNREYVAIGFSLKKQGSKDKKQKLLPYSQAVSELIQYQDRVQQLLDELESKKEFIIKIEEDSKQRLADIEKLTIMVKTFEKEAQARLDNIHILTDMVKQKEQDILKMEDLNKVIKEENQNLKVENTTIKEENTTIKEENQSINEYNQNLSLKLDNILNQRVVRLLRKIKIIK